MAAFLGSGDEEVRVMKRFLNNSQRRKGAGTWEAPVGRSLRAVLFIFLFLVQVCVIPVSAQDADSAVPCSLVSERNLNSGTVCGANVKAASCKKAIRKITSGGVKLSKTSYKYDGHAKKPSVTVKFGHKKLKKNRDYTVTYKNNRQRGTAKVIVKGRGLYSGTVTKTFRIK